MCSAVSQLPSPTRGAIRSGIAAPSFKHCVEELVVNGLDAGAKHICVEYDVAVLAFKVTDDGCGFTEESLEKAGVRYSTSKCSSKKDLDGNLRFYGFRGEALASISGISERVEINSRQRGVRLKLSKTISTGKDNTVTRTPVGESWTGETSISVKGLYSTMPVRRKALDVRLEEEFLIERLKRLAIVHPTISLILINRTEPELEIRIPRHEGSLTRFLCLFGNYDAARFMQEVSFAYNDKLLIAGAISRHGHDNKTLQFVFINGRPVLKTKIRKEVNEILKHSDICRRVEYLQKENGNITNRDVQMKNVTKKTYGVYFLNIICPYEEYDISFEPEKTMVEFRNWKEVLAGIRSCVGDFLKENNLLRTVEGKENYDTKKEVELVMDQRTESGSHVSHATVFGEMAQNLTLSESLHTSECQHDQSSVAKKTTSIENTSSTKFYDETSEGVNTSGSTVAQNIVHTNWTMVYDSNIGRNVYVNLVTGMSSSSNPCEMQDSMSFVADGTNSLSDGDYLSVFSARPKEERLKSSCCAVDMKEKMKNWKNPAIPVKANVLGRTDRRSFSSLFQSIGSSIKLGTDIFGKLQFVGQLDNKFIGCILKEYDSEKASSQENPETLILFDQHAAHERVRLEYLEKELWNGDNIKRCTLDTDLLLSAHDPSELRSLENWKEKFSKIGLDYRIERNERDKGCIRVTAVPEPFVQRAKKFRKESDQLVEMKSMVRILMQDQIQVFRNTAGASSTIPKCIFDTLCSQACHGAIRFGDSLRPNQCKGLLKSLSTCQLPFQCAHGRPSLTPITLPSVQKPVKRPRLNLQKLKNL